MKAGAVGCKLYLECRGSSIGGNHRSGLLDHAKVCAAYPLNARDVKSGCSGVHYCKRSHCRTALLNTAKVCVVDRIRGGIAVNNDYAIAQNVYLRLGWDNQSCALNHEVIRILISIIIGNLNRCGMKAGLAGCKLYLECCGSSIGGNHRSGLLDHAKVCAAYPLNARDVKSSSSGVHYCKGPHYRTALENTSKVRMVDRIRGSIPVNNDLTITQNIHFRSDQSGLDLYIIEFTAICVRGIIVILLEFNSNIRNIRTAGGDFGLLNNSIQVK